MPAFYALHTNISPEPNHFPLVATAGVFLLQANHVAQSYFHNHFFTSQNQGRYELISSRSDKATLRAASAKSLPCDA